MADENIDIAGKEAEKVYTERKLAQEETTPVYKRKYLQYGLAWIVCWGIFFWIIYKQMKWRTYFIQSLLGNSLLILFFIGLGLLILAASDWRN